MPRSISTWSSNTVMPDGCGMICGLEDARPQDNCTRAAGRGSDGLFTGIHAMLLPLFDTSGTPNNGEQRIVGGDTAFHRLSS